MKSRDLQTNRRILKVHKLHMQDDVAIARFAQLQADLRKDDDDTLQQLHEKVEQCASQCGQLGLKEGGHPAIPYVCILLAKWMFFVGWLDVCKLAWSPQTDEDIVVKWVKVFATLRTSQV